MNNDQSYPSFNWNDYLYHDDSLPFNTWESDILVTSLPKSQDDEYISYLMKEEKL